VNKPGGFIPNPEGVRKIGVLMNILFWKYREHRVARVEANEYHVCAGLIDLTTESEDIEVTIACNCARSQPWLQAECKKRGKTPKFYYDHLEPVERNVYKATG